MLEEAFYQTKNKRNICRKIFIINIIIIMVTFMILPSKNFAAQKRYAYTNNSLSSYAGYEGLIQSLKKAHQNWTFTILDTGLDWNEVIKNETVAVHGRNLIYYTNGGSWVCSTCGDKLFDSGRWKCASEFAVAYYMDPRNWLNENNIFQFENLAYNAEVQNIEGVKKILNTVPWASGDKITYTNKEGKQATLNKSYAQVIMEAAKEAGVSPYHLAARIKQEQGAGSTASSTGAGTYGGYVGYYNFFNIKATGSNIIGNALSHARTSGWDDPEKSIIGGAKFIAGEYINRGQSTLYLQKFDVDNTDGALYYHQYMQNVSAAMTEGQTVKMSYENMGFLSDGNTSINFVIPVYNNMPAEACPSPDGLKVVTQNVKVTGNAVAIRTGRTTASTEITKVNSGDVLLRIEYATVKQNGYFWDKIVLPNGTKGYIARDFITETGDVTNANISAVVNTVANLRNGPGTSRTIVVTTLTYGQGLNIIEIGKYNNIDGYNWSRVKLANGTQGYIVSDFLTEINKTNFTIAHVNCYSDSVVNVRSGVGTNYGIITSVGYNTEVSVVQKNAGQANGFSWDKIVISGSGLTGYIANEYLKYDEPEKQEEPKKQEKPKEEPKEPNKDPLKLDGENIVAIPESTVANVKTMFPKAIVKNGDIVLKDTDLIGTGNIIAVDDKKYTVVKLGDINGDGLIKSLDYMKIKNHIMETNKLDGAYLKAADVSGDGKITSLDYMKIKNYIMGTSKISL